MKFSFWVFRNVSAETCGLPGVAVLRSFWQRETVMTGALRPTDLLPRPRFRGDVDELGSPRQTPEGVSFFCPLMKKSFHRRKQ